MNATTPEISPLAEALAKLDEAMRPPRGSSSDPDRRRVAARLSDLARCEDGELSAFAKRHLPGRTVGEPALRAAREMILAIGRVLGPEGESAEALGVLQDVRHALDERLADAKKAAALREAEASAAEASPLALSAPPAPPIAHPVESLPFVPVPTPFPVPAPMPVPALAAAPTPWPEPPVWHTKPDHLASTMDIRLGGPVQPVLPFIQERPHVAATPSPPSTDAPSPTNSTGTASIHSPPPLTLSQYAGLVVACELYPLYAESTHTRYGVPTAAARAALDASWADRIADDPALIKQWQELCAAARRYFLQSR